MNTMEITKIVAGVCGALLLLLLVGWGSEIIYSTGGGHGDEVHLAYSIEIEEVGGEEEEAVEIDVAALVAAGDIAKGEKVYGKCKACHKLEDGANGTGPHLFGVVGRPIASVGGFGYSGALTGLADTAWTAEELFAFLTKPKDYAPGTKMSFGGLKKEADKANLIAYLETVK